MNYESACENCKYYKNGHCEKHDFDTQAEAICSTYEEAEDAR